MRYIITTLYIVVCMAMVTYQTGCLVAAAGAGAAGTVYYLKGDLEATFEATPEQVVAATKRAMDDLKLPILFSRASGLDGEVDARIGTDNKATVKVKSESEKLSKVWIRVGTFGDEAMSRQIYDRIKANLG